MRCWVIRQASWAHGFGCALVSLLDTAVSDVELPTSSPSPPAHRGLGPVAEVQC